MGNGAAPIRMIAVDMDGTLLGLNGRVSEENLAALRAAEQAGIEVVVATGRRHCYAMRILRDLGLRAESALVSSNGTVTRTVGTGTSGTRLIERTLMQRETALWLCEHLAEFRNALVITFDRVQPDGEDARGALVVEEMEELHSSIGRWMAANEPYIEHVRPIEQALRLGLEDDAPIQMMLCGTIERMRRAERRLLEDARVFAPGMSRVSGVSGVAGTVQTMELDGVEVVLSRTEYPDRDLSLVDILPAGCSKGVALLRLAAGFGISAAEMMAIGDNWNDLSMLEIAGRPVLMENAPEDLKATARERGWELGGHHDRHGVAVAIGQALERNAAIGNGRVHGMELGR